MVLRDSPAQASETALRLALAQAGVLTITGGRLPAVGVAGPGHAVRVNWSPVPGVNRAEVTSAPVSIGVAVVEEALGDLTFRKANRSYDVTIPDGKRVFSLTLYDLKQSGSDTPITSLSNIPANHRLVVSPYEGGQPGSPRYSVPSVGQRGLLPPSLTGATFSNKVLRLPHMPAGKIRLSLVTGPYPEEFAEQDFSLDRVTGISAVFPADLELVDHAGEVLWAYPGEYPPNNPPMDLDLRVNFESAFNELIAGGQPLDLTFRLRGRAPGQAGFSFSLRGTLVRDFPGVKTLELDGDPVVWPLGVGTPLSNETPSSATGDLTVTYKGIRVLEELSDALPTGGAVSGRVVADELVARAFPPRAFRDLALARIGIIGRAPIDCELSVQAVQLVGNRIASVVGILGVLQISASHTLQTHWLELPPDRGFSGENIGLALRASLGRFFWASLDDQPLAKLAIFDADPAGKPLRINGTVVINVTQPNQVHLPAHAFPKTEFLPPSPTLDSSLFLTVDVSDLALRYAR
jgi:hypothetical protein